jgi:type II secretory pathway component GspD/PulD (secretin)
LAGAGAVLAEPVNGVQDKPPAAEAAAEEDAKPASLQDPIDLKVNGADGRDVLKTFATVLSANLVLAPEVQGEVTFNLENIPMQKALERVCKSLGCDWSYTEGSEGKAPELLIVKSPSPPQK